MNDRFRRLFRASDAQGRLLVTTIEGRTALILPPFPEDKQAEWLARIVDALESVGIELLLDKPS